MSRPVIVVECEPEAFEFLRDSIHGHLRGLWEEGTLEDQPYRIHLAVDESAEMVLDVFREPKAGAGRHVVRAGDEGWTMEHSLMCRMAGLENCPLNELVRVGFDEGHLPSDGPGVWRVWVDRNALQWEEEL